ncbi:MAG: DoxX family protein [Acidobacteriaceae bacterium]
MKAKSIAYWITTILVAFSMGGGIAQLARVPGVVDGFVRILHYPTYFVTILGFWKVAGAIAILIPRFPRLKEWAYAGIIFDLTGAAASNFAVGGSVFHILSPLIAACFAVTSWALRPPSRKIGVLFPGEQTNAAVAPRAADIA